MYVLAALSGEGSKNGARRRFLRHHTRRVERFAAAMLRENRNLGADAAEAHAELLLGALDGLAFRWARDEDYPFPSYARKAADRLS